MMKPSSLCFVAMVLGCTPQEIVARDDAATVRPDASASDATSGADAGDVAALPDAGDALALPDTGDAAPNDADGGTVSDAAVWPTNGDTLTLRVRGGLPQPPLPGSTCTFNNHTYTYRAATGALRHAGCYGDQLVDRAVTLDATGRAALEVELTALRTTTDLRCGADFHELELTVSVGGATRTYNSTYFAGCPGSTLAPPFVAGDALNRLDAVLAYTIQTCADGDAGRHCTAVDAGAPDGG